MIESELLSELLELIFIGVDHGVSNILREG